MKELKDKIEPGNEASFFQLVALFAMTDRWCERFRGHGITSVLELGMGDPLALLSLAECLGVDHVEGYDACSEEVGVARAKEKNHTLVGGTVKEMLQSFSATMPQQCRSAFPEPQLYWEFDLLKQPLVPNRAGYDLVVMSNLLHYWARRERQHVLGQISDVLKSSRFVYIHVKEKSTVARARNLNFEALREDCDQLAQELQLVHYGPFRPLGGINEALDVEEGARHVWTNL